MAAGYDIGVSGAIDSSPKSATGATQFGPVFISTVDGAGLVWLGVIGLAVWWVFFRKK